MVEHTEQTKRNFLMWYADATVEKKELARENNESLYLELLAEYKNEVEIIDLYRDAKTGVLTPPRT